MSVIVVSPESSKPVQERRDGVHVASGSETNTIADSSSEGKPAHEVVLVAQLRARVEQQSSLIGMLKQRNDDTFMQVSKESGRESPRACGYTSDRVACTSVSHAPV